MPLWQSTVLQAEVTYLLINWLYSWLDSGSVNIATFNALLSPRTLYMLIRIER